MDLSVCLFVVYAINYWANRLMLPKLFEQFTIIVAESNSKCYFRNRDGTNSNHH